MICHVYDVMTNIALETVLLKDDRILDIKALWKNDNPTYYKFILRIKRGSSEKSQMAFREVLYG